LSVSFDLDVGEHRAQNHEVPEFRVDQVAVNPHVTETGFDRDRLVRDDPGHGLMHLHGEAHGRIHCANAARFELGDDFRADVGDLVTGAMELEIGDGSRSTAHRLAGHTHHKAHKRLGPGLMAQDLIPLRVEARAADLDKSRIIRAAFDGELAECRRVKALGGGLAGSLLPPARKRFTLG
jgi:hypothetical protein